MISSLSIFISLTAISFFFALWCLVCGSFLIHLLVCYCLDASTLISSLACFLHLPSIKFIAVYFFFLLFLYLLCIPFLLSSFYSCNYLLGHYKEQVLLLCSTVWTFTIYIDLINALYIKCCCLFSFGNTRLCTLLHFILFVLLPLPVLPIPSFHAFGFLFIPTFYKFHLISLEAGVPFTFSFVFLCLFLEKFRPTISFSWFIFLNFHLNIFSILSNISPLNLFSLNSRYPCNIFQFLSAI